VPLVEGGLNLDSVNLLELIVKVEDAFGVTIEDEDISAERFSTLGSHAAFVRHRRAARFPSAERHSGQRAPRCVTGSPFGSGGGPPRRCRVEPRPK
jgi:hypothetical protein